jgi:hypothetical protein
MRTADQETFTQAAERVLATSDAKVIGKSKEPFNKLTSEEKEDFLSRIVIFDSVPRIDKLPELIKNAHLRTVQVKSRDAVFQRLEGWWHNEIIDLLTGKRVDPVANSEISFKLCQIADEYKSDNLPITFAGKMPAKIDESGDTRLFVRQLREIGLTTDTIRFAIIDYYRAYEQRSQWARESLVIAGEVEQYEEKLTEEWARYKAFLFEDIDESSTEEILKAKGKELYKWAQTNCMNIRIRERVDEPFVVRGGFQMLANDQGSPTPRIYWHPQFLQRLQNLLGTTP